MKTYSKTLLSSVLLAGAISLCSLNGNAGTAAVLQQKTAPDTGKMHNEKMKMEKKKMAKMKKGKMKMEKDTMSKM
ncbi:hypothetical protein A0256_05595 [Mucilaginibacter sp. PAMC 26640]|nr:hypothetical protein A0256_05595 [Mucilaginibacter sp. PAMC 26640]